jgi:hypothetical protein
METILMLFISLLGSAAVVMFLFGIVGHIIETSQKLDKIMKHLGIEDPKKE